MRSELRIEFVDGHADVWRLFDHPEQLGEIAEALIEPFRGDVTKVAGIESRGFILGTAAALALGVGFVPVRKADALPRAEGSRRGRD
jgi:adenine phosphoribosyltransferase